MAETYLSDTQVAARYGVHRTTPWRWAKTELSFPKPFVLSPGCTRSKPPNRKPAPLDVGRGLAVSWSTGLRIKYSASRSATQGRSKKREIIEQLGRSPLHGVERT